MKVYIDLFFVFNIIMDFITLLGVSIILKRNTSIIRIILSSVLGGVISLLLFTSINKILLEIVSIILIVFISFGYKGIGYVIKNILYMYLLSVLLGGLIYLFNIRVSDSVFLSYFIIIVISVLTLILYIKEIKKIRNNYNNYYKVDIYFKDCSSISVVGFLDTGNNIYDPYKKRMVILLSNKFVGGDKYLLVPYYTASGNGLLKCISPDKVFIDGVLYKGDILVGFTDVSMMDGVDVILHKDIMERVREC